MVEDKCIFPPNTELPCIFPECKKESCFVYQLKILGVTEYGNSKENKE